MIRAIIIVLSIAALVVLFGFTETGKEATEEIKNRVVSIFEERKEIVEKEAEKEKEKVKESINEAIRSTIDSVRDSVVESLSFNGE